MKNKEKMLKWYTDSLNTHGENDFRSLTWGDEEGKSAELRYDQMNSEVSFSGKSIFEVGCGWGSFFDFGYSCKTYMGIDILGDFIDIAYKKYGNLPNAKFFVEDISHILSPGAFDLTISSGVAGNRGGPACEPKQLLNYLRKMYSCSNTVLVNFPSNRATIRTENVEYFSPEYVLGQALCITDNVKIIHKNKFDFLLRLDHNE